MSLSLPRARASAFKIISCAHPCVQKRYFFGKTLGYLFCDLACERQIKIAVKKIAPCAHHIFVVAGIFGVFVLRIEKVEIAFFGAVKDVSVTAHGAFVAFAKRSFAYGAKKSCHRHIIANFFRIAIDCNFIA